MDIKEKNFDNLLTNPEYNIEEKTFLNRIAFYVFKKYGFGSNFKKFAKYVNII